MNQEWLEKIKKNQLLVAIAGFCAVAALVMILCICLLREPIVPVCVLVMIEGALAVLLHHVELWLHGVLVLAQIIAGILLGQPALVILCAVVYAAATVTLKYMLSGEE